MLWAFWCGNLTVFCLLYVGLWLVTVALLPHGDGRSHARLVDPAIDRLTRRTDRSANRVLGRLADTGSRWGPTGVRESDTPGLAECARRFEEAIEKIRLSHHGSRRRVQR
jgi:hypothetical protein